MNEIIPGLYLGDIESSTDLESLVYHNIHHIISILARDEYLVPLKSHLLITLRDGSPYTPKQLEIGVNFIKQGMQKGEGVLVHCMAGISRSSTLIGAYLMKEHKYSPIETIRLMQNQREIVDPAYFTFRSAINWVYPDITMICNNPGCGKIWDYREKYEFINYAFQRDDLTLNSNEEKPTLVRLPKECDCEVPDIKMIKD
jgi:hypothetical protein